MHRRIIGAAVVVLLAAAPATAQNLEPYPADAGNSFYREMPSSIARALTISGGDGRTATIDFGGDSVTYSGPLPVDDAAKVFFNAVLRRMQIEACGPPKGEREAQ